MKADAGEPPLSAPSFWHVIKLVKTPLSSFFLGLVISILFLPEQACDLLVLVWRELLALPEVQPMLYGVHALQSLGTLWLPIPTSSTG